MHNYTLITKLFSRYFKKYIIQCRKLRENPAKCEILALKVIQKPDQVMLCTGAAKSEDLIFIMYLKIHEEDFGYPEADFLSTEELQR